MNPCQSYGWWKSDQWSDCGYPVDGGYSEDVTIYVLHIDDWNLPKMSKWILLKAS